MSLKRGEVNALGILGLRKLDWIPQHFTKITTSEIHVDIRLLEQWIEFNLNGRYSFRRTMVVNSDKKLIESLEIGLEDPTEISMLVLGCPLLNARNN